MTAHPRFSLTPVQQRAMEIIRAAPRPISRFGLSRAMGLERGNGYRLAARLIERGHARLSEGKLSAVELRFVPVAPPQHRLSSGPRLIRGLTLFDLSRPVRNGWAWLIMGRPSNARP